MTNQETGLPGGGPGENGRSSGRYPYNMGASAPVPPPTAPRWRDTPDGGLFRQGMLHGLTLCIFLLFNTFFAFVYQTGTVRSLCAGDPAFAYLMDASYSLFCVFVPFLAGLLLQRAQRGPRAPLPFGPPRSGYRAFLLVFAGLGVCLAGSLLTNLFANWADSAGITFRSYELALQGDVVPATLAGKAAYVLRSALVPALVEEFAVRGVILQPLRRYGDWFAILVSALVFGLMHHNMTQVPFAVVAGLALGYCAVVTGSLWITILIHFLNNFIAVSYALVEDAYGARAGLFFSNAAMYGFMGIGLLALVFYALRTPGLFRLRPGEIRGTNKGFYFAAPTLILAFAVLLVNTAMDISLS